MSEIEAQRGGLLIKSFEFDELSIEKKSFIKRGYSDARKRIGMGSIQQMSWNERLT